MSRMVLRVIGALISRRMNKSGNVSWPNGSNGQQITTWTPVAPATVTSNRLDIPAELRTPGRTVTARAEFSGAGSTNHWITVRNQSGTTLATSPTVTANAGTCAVDGTLDLTGVTSLGVFAHGAAFSNGTLQAAGTYLEVT